VREKTLVVWIVLKPPSRRGVPRRTRIIGVFYLAEYLVFYLAGYLVSFRLKARFRIGLFFIKLGRFFCAKVRLSYGIGLLFFKRGGLICFPQYVLPSGRQLWRNQVDRRFFLRIARGRRQQSRVHTAIKQGLPEVLLGRVYDLVFRLGRRYLFLHRLPEQTDKICGLLTGQHLQITINSTFAFAVRSDLPGCFHNPLYEIAIDSVRRTFLTSAHFFVPFLEGAGSLLAHVVPRLKLSDDETSQICIEPNHRQLNPA
jgi:hypothetical protein